MKLKAWMKKNNINDRALAEMLEVDRTTVNKYANGTRRPSLRIAVKIELLTKCLVTCEDLLKS